jgi:hypothetical protein
MTSKKQVQSYNTNKHHLLMNDLDDLTNNNVYPVPKFSTKEKKKDNSNFKYFLILHFLK